MAKTAFNPITTKWQGALGGFRYSILRGKQVISERPSHVRNPRTEKQMSVRMRFKLATQFSALWSILQANLVKREPDSVLARAFATKTAFASALPTGNSNEAAVLDLEEFASLFNANTSQTQDPNLTVLFSSTTQTITAPQGVIVTYQVVAFGDDDLPIGSTVRSYTANGSAATIILPLVRGSVKRYDLMVFTATPGVDYVAGPLGNISGDDPLQININTYAVLMDALSTETAEISGITTDSCLTA